MNSESEKKVKKRRFGWKSKTALVCVLLFVAWAWFNFSGPRAKPGVAILKKDPAISFLSEPVDENNDIDYLAAINKQNSVGVTVDNNAVVKFVEATGPIIDGDTLPARFYELLGIDRPADQGNYLAYNRNWSKLHPKLKDDYLAREDFIWEATYAESYLWNPDELPLVDEWLNDNQQALDLVVEGCQRPRLFCPLVSECNPAVVSAQLSFLQVTRNFVRMLSARASRSIHQKNYELWKRDVVALYQLAILQSQGSTLIELLVALAIDGIAGSAVDAGLSSGAWNDKQLADLQQTLNKLPTLESTTRFLQSAERYMGLDFLQSIPRSEADWSGELSSSFGPDGSVFNVIQFFPADMNIAARAWNQEIDKLVAASKIKDPGQRLARLEELESEIELLSESSTSGTNMALSLIAGPRARGKVVGDVVSALLLPGFHSVEIASVRQQQRRILVGIAIALERYKLANGKYPAKLTALVPKYLPGIQNDLFGNALLYKIDGDRFQLYSLGPNQTDEGGTYEGGDDLFWERYEHQPFKEFIEEFK